MISLTDVEYGSSWWSFAESDQFAATLNLLDGRYHATLERTSSFWRKHYVDPQYKGIFDGVKRDGTGWGWPLDSTSKCNQWKSGYHAVEHALVMYMTGKYLEKKPIPLYFAIPSSEVQRFSAKPYLFEAQESARTDLGTVSSDLKKVRVLFEYLR